MLSNMRIYAKPAFRPENVCQIHFWHIYNVFTLFVLECLIVHFINGPTTVCLFGWQIALLFVPYSRKKICHFMVVFCLEGDYN